MQAFRSHHQHFGDELIKAVIDQHVGDFITNFGDGLIKILSTRPRTWVATVYVSRKAQVANLGKTRFFVIYGS